MSDQSDIRVEHAAPRIYTNYAQRVNEIFTACVTAQLKCPLNCSVKMICDSASITAEQLPSDLDDEGKLTRLRRLLCEGVIDVEARMEALQEDGC
jgi:hypothetical protein